jgi:amino acid adenylation domain-containing protein
VDRQALAPPQLQPERGYEAPQGEVETELARIWAEVLKLERVGRHDNFFELGGHSLAAVRVGAAVQQTLGMQLTLAQLFGQPTLATLAQSLTAVPTGSQQAPIAPVARGGDLPLSFAQQRMWFLAKVQGLGRAYHVPLALRVDGPLDRRALVAALDRLVERHEALRTTFPVVQGQAVQRIAPAGAGFALREHDLTGTQDAPAALQRLQAEEAEAPFDLAAGPLVRGRLVALGAERHVLLLTLHHIVTDGWSMGVFARELQALYGAFRLGQHDPLPALPIQYADYAAWQRREDESDRLRGQAEYWRATLAGAPALLGLPTDRPRPAQQDHAGAAVAYELGAPLVQRLKALSQRHGTTLFMTLLAGWAALLSRLSGDRDLVIGTPVANRSRAELEPLMGLFINTLALRLQLPAEATVAQLLQQVKQKSLQAQAHQDLPFEQVVEIVQPQRSAAHSPLFQVVFSWHAAGADAPALPGLEVRREAAPYEVARFDLTFQLAEQPDGRVAGRLEYATALFERQTVERQLGYLERILEAMAADEQLAVDRLPWLPEAERQQLLVQWNDTRTSYPRDEPVHALFEAQAARTPLAPALVQDGRTLSYAELDRAANALAHRLQANGVRAGEMVALALQRSVELVVAQLAVLKAGAAYVPLDVLAPAARQAAVVQDCGARLVLCARDTAGLPGAAQRLVVDVDDPDVPAGSPAPVARPQGGGDLAYVMYTSGSTGGAKGVMVPHRAIVRLVRENRFASFGPQDRVAFAANPAFDASTLEVWAPLLNGGCLVVLGQQTLLSPAELARSLAEQRVTVLWLTVGLFNQVADALAEVIPRLRCLIVGGDALDPVVMARVLRRGGPRHLLNGYGPTESTTFAATYEITQVAPGQRSIPIGRPIGNTRLYILDSLGQPVPVGVSGELHIGGDGVALGYLNQPQLTADRFVPDPFVQEPDARMYRTGDLARWLPDGNVEFLGRNDHQVKLRGFRVELGEIVAKLLEQPGVREAVVLVREDSPGDKRLVAYLVADHVDALGLRAQLATQLPEYMLPAAYVRLDALPLNANGKVESKALPPPAAHDFVLREYEPPREGTEAELARIWAEMLQVERVGRHDHFFELGGHSLLAIGMVERMRRQGLQVDARALFSTPTLAVVAAATRKIKEVVL